MKTLICIPTLNTVPVQFMYSLIGLLGRSAGHVNLAIEQNSLIPEARNALALRAVDKGYDRLMFVDSDMVFEPDVLERLSETMEQYNADLVSALFFTRKPPIKPTICKELTWERNEDTGVITHGAEFYTDYPKDKVFQIAGTGMACTLITTDLVKEVTEQFNAPPFTPLPMMSEDFTFCHKAEQLGRYLVCDSRVKVGHLGTMIYDESIYDAQKGNT